MRYANCMKTVMGGLSLVLVLSACSSASKSKTTSASPSGDMSRSDDVRRGAKPTISPPTDLPRSDVVTDRGTSRRTVSDPTDRARLSDRSPEIAAACPSRTDAQGTMVFEDPTCPDRYRSQLGNTGNTSERDRAGLTAACSSRTDANGKIIYDDPTCPDRYRRQTAGTNDYAGVDPRCPSTIDAKGKVIYADAACAERYRFQTKENAFYDRYADKAAKHARAAEIAGNEGNLPDMIEDAELSLDHAKEARRANNNPDLAAGIAALRQSIALGHTNEVSGATSSIHEARVRLSRAAGIKVWDTAAGARIAPRAQTIKGELSRRENVSQAGGGEQYVLRDSQNREMPISLSPEMSRQVQVGDVVEAQVDSSGNVTSISKTQ